jgi:TPP-dependent pyruvate/acetoin dehydrogenase alpha subunit
MAGKVKKRVAATAPAKAFSLISDAKLRQLYATMLKCRAIREQVSHSFARMKSADEVKPARLPEATVVGTTIDLRPEDWVSPSEGDFAAALVKGVPLESILEAAGGVRNSGALLQPVHNVLRPSLSSAAKMRIATGIGLANRENKSGHVALVFLRAKTLAGRHWREVASFASKDALPILFVVYEEHSEDARNSKKRIKQASQTAEYGFPVIPVDANDVVAIYRVAHESIQKARQGRGPTLIEATTFQAAKEHRKKDPGGGKPDDGIAKMEEYLTRKGLFTAAWKQKIVDRFQRDIHAALKAAK